MMVFTYNDKICLLLFWWLHVVYEVEVLLSWQAICCLLESFPPGLNGFNFACSIFIWIFIIERFLLLIQISLKFVDNYLIDSKSLLVNLVVWHQTDNKPFHELVHQQMYAALNVPVQNIWFHFTPYPCVRCDRCLLLLHSTQTEVAITFLDPEFWYLWIIFRTKYFNVQNGMAIFLGTYSHTLSTIHVYWIPYPSHNSDECDMCIAHFGWNNNVINITIKWNVNHIICTRNTYLNWYCLFFDFIFNHMYILIAISSECLCLYPLCIETDGCYTPSRQEQKQQQLWWICRL